MRLIDVTAPLGATTRVYPGDPPFHLEVAADPDRGDPARVSALHMGTHTGTHVDAPSHLPGGRGGVEVLPLQALIGPAVVVAARGPVVGAAEARRLARRAIPRILFRGAPLLSPEAAEQLAASRVRLVGTDGLSIDPADSRDFPAHRRLLGAGVVLLEGLDLSQAPPGRYTLFALPLLVPGADGAPARALLRPLRRRARSGR